MIIRNGTFVKTAETLEIQYNRYVRPICLPCLEKPRIAMKTSSTAIKAIPADDKSCVKGKSSVDSHNLRALSIMMTKRDYDRSYRHY